MSEELKILVGSALAFYGGKTDEELAELGYKRAEEDIQKIKDDAEYWEKVYSEEAKLDYTDEERKKLISRALHRYVRSYGGEKFIATEHSKNILSLCYDLLKENKKGILLTGSTGVGKTTVLRAMLSVPFTSIYPEKWHQNKPLITTALEVIGQYNLDTTKGIEQFAKGEVYFDDLGNEPKQAYASKGEDLLFSQIIELRYARRRRTHFTTNLSLDEVRDKYGKRVHSRIHEMCHIVEFNDKDWRLI